MHRIRLRINSIFSNLYIYNSVRNFDFPKISHSQQGKRSFAASFFPHSLLCFCQCPAPGRNLVVLLRPHDGSLSFHQASYAPSERRARRLLDGLLFFLSLLLFLAVRLLRRFLFLVRGGRRIFFRRHIFILRRRRRRFFFLYIRLLFLSAARSATWLGVGFFFSPLVVLRLCNWPATTGFLLAAAGGGRHAWRPGHLFPQTYSFGCSARCGVL